MSKHDDVLLMSKKKGSITWGNLWDKGNVLSATVLTIEEEPQLLTISDPQALQTIIHNCGLTAIIVDLTFALAPAQAWQQYVVAFDTGVDQAAVRYAPQSHGIIR